MLRYALPLFAAPFALAAVAAPLSAAEIQIEASGPVVELSLTETVKAKPDIVNVGTGVSTRAMTAALAMKQNAAAMTKVVDRIKALGIPAKDIQTSGINLGAVYDYDQASSKQVFKGYQASNRVSVTLRNIEQTGPVLDALVTSGATEIDGPTFALEDDKGPRDQARKAVMARAQAQALDYAKMAGYSGVKLLEINETVYSQAPQPYAMMRLQSAAAADASTPVEPGMVGTSVTVTVKYEMTNR